MEQHHSELTAAGLHVAAVGIGEPKHAQRYCGELAPSVTCFVNKTLEAYRAFGMREGTMLELFGPQAIINAAGSFGRGARQGAATGNALMLGGVVLIDATGIVRYAMFERYTGEHPAFSDILAEVQRWSRGNRG